MNKLITRGLAVAAAAAVTVPLMAGGASALTQSGSVNCGLGTTRVWINGTGRGDFTFKINYQGNSDSVVKHATSSNIWTASWKPYGFGYGWTRGNWSASGVAMTSGSGFCA